MIHQMSLQIIEESVSALTDYGTISPAFRVRSRFAVEPIDGGPGGLQLRLVPVEPSYVKDYDRDEDEGPKHWLERWDLGRWGLLAAINPFGYRDPIREVQLIWMLDLGSNGQSEFDSESLTDCL